MLFILVYFFILHLPEIVGTSLKSQFNFAEVVYEGNSTTLLTLMYTHGLFRS